jgi:hypothetical protein
MYLFLSKSGDKFILRVQSLDGPPISDGVPAEDRIEFVREGKIETIHAGSGQGAAMKWLLDSKHCQIIKVGEGFCLD